MVRGDTAEETLLERATELVRAQHIGSDADLEPLFEHPPPDIDPETLNRLRQMHEAGGWDLVQAALAGLPIDLRWLFASGAGTRHHRAAFRRSCRAAWAEGG